MHSVAVYAMQKYGRVEVWLYSFLTRFVEVNDQFYASATLPPPRQRLSLWRPLNCLGGS
jgi:hypothetical protein